MENSKDTRRAIGALLLCIAIASLVYVIYGNRLIESAYNGDSLHALNSIIAAHRSSRPWGTLEHYFLMGRLLFSRILIVFIAAYLLILAIVRRRDVLGTMKRFFGAATHPINLALFRIVLFSTIVGAVDVPLVTAFAQLPPELRAAPPGLGLFLQHLAPGTTLTAVLATLLLACSFTGMIGLFTRTSALLTAGLGLYVLGLPNFFGKIDHNQHHLVWFSALLAASPCGAALSCDAMIAAWRRADHGETRPPGSSSEFALPLRFVMVLLGESYFFAGFWKLWESGVDWVLTDNLKFIMYQKWFELGGYVPFFRIDHYSLLCKAGALATIIFELSVIVLIFSDRFRPLIAIQGVFFHTMTDVFMRIPFKELLRCHVVFLDWDVIFRGVGARIYRNELSLLYDGKSRSCRRFIAFVRAVDIFGRVNYLNALDEETIGDHRLLAVMDVRRWAGLPAYRVVAARIPFLWPALPLLYLWPISAGPSRPVRDVQDSSTGGSVYRPAPVLRGHGRGRIAMICTFSVLFAGNFLASVTRTEGWPFTVYPTFAGRAVPESTALELAVADANGVILQPRRTLREMMPPQRFAGQLALILSTLDSPEAGQRLAALGQVWKQNESSLQPARYISLYRITASTIPEQAPENPLRRDLLLEEPF